MDSQLLVHELERLRDGQQGAERRVLFLLSRSNMILLTEEPVNVDSGESVVVKARLSRDPDRPTAFLFSSEERLEAWAMARGFEPNGLILNGVDMAIALPSGTWIQIDPGTPYSALISPRQLDQLMNIDASSDLFPGAPGVSVKESRDDGFVTPTHCDPPATSMPTQVSDPQPTHTHPTLSPQQEGAKRKFVPRSSPTTFFSAPELEKREEQPSRPRTYTSSNLGKVIRTTKPDDFE